jgi:hypothetical protein
MHLHLVRVAAAPREARYPRPAKVVALEARRKARLERIRPKRLPPKPAA